jgi:two-component system LytT family response regulator
MATIVPAERSGRTADAVTGWNEGVSASRLFVRRRGSITPILLRDIERIDADDDYASLTVRGRVILVNITMNALEARLNPARFLRVHRSHIVNLDHVESFVPWGNGQLEVRLLSGSRVVASRARSKLIRHLAV